jgi:uncharacterized RDD family membrane protein YckC
MVSTPRSLSAQPALAGAAPATITPARLSVRLSAYLIDSVVLLGFILAFFALAGLVLLLSSDLGRQDPPDAAYYAFMGVFIGGTVIAWSIFNLALARWRGQTAGQYIAGLRTVSEDARPMSTGRLLIRWFGLHPLLFHPLLIPVWGLFAAITVSLTLDQIVLAFTLGLVALCVVAPLAALASATFDGGRRALHDRLAGTIVISADKR